MRSVSITALALALACAGTAHAAPDSLDQGWSPSDRTYFYTTSQGSQLLPYEWFLALEQPSSESLFSADSLARFGYLPNPDRVANPDGLPLGFAKDIGDHGDWIGMTCAACHTNQIDFAGKTLRIDGAPTDADMWAFIAELGSSLAQTSSSRTDPKFARFAARIRNLRAGQPTASDDMLFKELAEFSARYALFIDSSKSAVPWGRARLDAFGMIFNRATAIDLDDWSNAHSPNAPVSYPFLWDTHWHDKVQWNGSAPNVLTVEKLARNVGEVLGVFARTDIRKPVLPPLFFKTSAKRLNLLLIEQKLSLLRSPVWPPGFPAIDAGKAAMGKKLYARNCQGCHAITPRNKPLAPTAVTMTPLPEVGTDPLMATNAVTLQSKSGILEGVTMPFLLSEPLPASGPSVALTLKIVVGAILAPPDWNALPVELDNNSKGLTNLIQSGRPQTDGMSLKAAAQKVKNDLANNALLRSQMKAYLDKRAKESETLAYKARPLDGIWATAPYLHNGSVPNLFQLLLPVERRAKLFSVGTRDFDPVNVGFVTESRPGATEFDTSRPGNSNAGHDTYGTDELTDDERWQLVEYLKTL